MTYSLTVHRAQHVALVVRILEHGLVALVPRCHLARLEDLTRIAYLRSRRELDALCSFAVDFPTIILIFLRD